MKTRITTLTILFISLLFLVGETLNAQQSRDLQYYRSPDKTGLNVFESPKTTDVMFDGINVRLGGANTLQFQGLDHSNDGVGELNDLGSNFNLATSNLDLDVQLHNGLRMHLRTFLSSRHHAEAWVKGGYLQIDRLDFIQEGFMSELMDKITVKIGHMEINYGDNHFRRSDNGQALYNPFVGNYILDSFTTEVGGEVYFKNNGFLAMVGLTNGKLNQSVVKSDIDEKASFVAKLGYDSQINEDMRIRLTGSIYTSPESPAVYLYSGDRAGARYYDVMEGSFRSGRFNPGFGNEITAIMINPFIKYQGLEFYGVYENSTGKSISETSTRTFNQLGAELLYRFGAEEKVYLGGRYNLVTGEIASGDDVEITRLNIGGGWFMTSNVLAKLEYVTQQYNDFPSGDLLAGGEFSGIMLEAVISF
ncbi:MAG: hypothetical protein WD035_08855 [Balneolaceae bacterium]